MTDTTPLEQVRVQIRLRKAVLSGRRRTADIVEARNRYRLREKELDWIDAVLVALARNNVPENR